MTWYTDGSATNGGFVICASPPPLPPSDLKPTTELDLAALGTGGVPARLASTNLSTNDIGNAGATALAL